MSVKKDNVKTALKNIGDRLIREARLNLDGTKSRDKGGLRKSLDYSIFDEDGVIGIRLIANEYAKYIDEGRGPTKSGGSGTKPGALRRSIEGWVRRNRARLDSRRGEFKGLKNYQVKSLAFIISQKIHNEGFEGNKFLTNAFKTIEPYLDNKLVDAYKKDIELEIERILKK